MVIMTGWHVECLECGEVCVGGCSPDWLREHAGHEADPVNGTATPVAQRG